MNESERNHFHIRIVDCRHCGAGRLSERQSSTAEISYSAAILYGDMEHLYSLHKYGKLGAAHGGHSAA